MTAVRIAVIGAGLIGRKHIEVLRTGIGDYVLAGVVDPSAHAALEATQFGYPCFSEIEELLDSIKPDGAVVAVPNQMHKAAGLACVNRGIPILVEKPIADSVTAALDLVAAAKRLSVPILVGHHRRHNPIMRKAEELIRHGGIGSIIAVNGLWLSHKPKDYFDVAWRREVGGGPVLINAIHDIDCLRMLCGDVESVQSSTTNSIRGLNVEESAAAVLRFQNGALGTLLVSDTVSSPWTWEWTSGENPAYPHLPENCYLIAGNRGSLAVPSLVHRWHAPGQESWGNPLRESRISYVAADPFIEQMSHFARVIRGLEAPVVNGIDGTRTLATTIAIHRSSKEGKPIVVEDLMVSASEAIGH